LITKGCYSSVSVFTVDYDAPTCGASAIDQTKLLGSLVQSANSTSLIGGLNGTATVGSNRTVTTSSPSAVVTNNGGRSMKLHGVAVLCLAVAILLFP
jgi:5'-nucleotidase